MSDDSDLPGALGAGASIVLTGGLLIAVGLLPPAVFYMAIGAVAVASASLLRRRDFLWGIAGVVVVADLAGLVLGHEVWLGYFLAILAALATAAVADLWIASVRALTAAQLAIEREMERRREEAEAASTRKNRFLAAVSHDIRTPANAIRLQAALIRRRAVEPATMGEVPALTSQLEQSASSLVDLVSDMLDLTRLDGGVELRESAFDLDRVIEHECMGLRPVDHEVRVHLLHVPTAHPLWLHADRIKIARIIRNLLENGMKFTAAGQVRVEASIAADGRIRVEVTDTGAGIAPRDVPDIFDEFVQLRNPERARRKGSGLGLAICKRLVELMGGMITVDSTPGEGSRFVVWLPAAMAVPAPDGEDDGVPLGPTSLAGVRVVLAEDHDVTRETCTALLRGEGANVTEARDGVEALELVESVQPQVLLLDLMMPRLDGVGVLRRLQETRPTPLEAVIVVSGDRRAQAADEMRRLGADAVIAKPIDPSRLVHLLRGVTGRLQAGR